MSVHVPFQREIPSCSLNSMKFEMKLGVTAAVVPSDFMQLAGEGRMCHSL